MIPDAEIAAMKNPSQGNTWADDVRALKRVLAERDVLVHALRRIVAEPAEVMVGDDCAYCEAKDIAREALA